MIKTILKLNGKAVKENKTGKPELDTVMAEQLKSRDEVKQRIGLSQPWAAITPLFSIKTCLHWNKFIFLFRWIGRWENVGNYQFLVIGERQQQVSKCFPRYHCSKSYQLPEPTLCLCWFLQDKNNGLLLELIFQKLLSHHKNVLVFFLGKYLSIPGEIPQISIYL